MQKLQQHYSKKHTPQSQPIPGSNQVKNNAGGYVYQITPWEQLDRFLILGTSGGTYYVNENKLTRENAAVVEQCLMENYPKAVDRIVEISQSGRAPKNDPTLFALALATSLPCPTSILDEPVPSKTEILKFALAKVARTTTHLFTFLEYVKEFRGWGRCLREIVKHWYDNHSVDQLAYQIVKYRQREGWTHLDVMNLSRPGNFESFKMGKDPYTKSQHDPIYRYLLGNNSDLDVQLGEDLPQIIRDFETLIHLEDNSIDKKRAISLLKENKGLTWEMLPTHFLKDPDIWKALIPNLPLTATMRNLGNMTACGAILPGSDEQRTVCEKLTNEEQIQKSRIHPLNVLVGMRTYASGKGFKGNQSWAPNQKIVDALDQAFYMAFKNAEPTNKRILIGLDVSGSMTYGSVAGIQCLNPREASGALCMIHAKTEPNCEIMAFSEGFIPVEFSKRTRLDDVLKSISTMGFSGTDCSLPMLYAIQNNMKVDCFIIYTDNETWYGKVHPKQALDKYRRKFGIPAKLIVCAMTSTVFSIADPQDKGMLDIVGCDSATPALIRDFIMN
jgi:60 kDa SS-A/Ro ribonucleoprotein